MDPAQFREKLAALQRGFREKAPGRVAEVESAWERARGEGTGGDAWSEMIAIAHSLAGSSLPMGFPSLGAAARDLEHAALRRRHDSGTLTPADLDRFARLVARLREALG
jgi:HPt (histidine-containing phosphotransfer) domain-containing protein